MNSCCIPLGNLCIFTDGVPHPTPLFKDQKLLFWTKGKIRFIEFATLSLPSLRGCFGSFGFLDLSNCIPPLSLQWSMGGPRSLSEATTFVGFLRKGC